jgi:hypothetical protein
MAINDEKVSFIKIGYITDGKTHIYKKYQNMYVEHFIITPLQKLSSKSKDAEPKKVPVYGKLPELRKVPIFKDMKQFDEYIKKHGDK